MRYQHGSVARNSLRREGGVGSALLGGNPERALDELRLTYRVPAAQPFDLPLPQHVQRFDAFEDLYSEETLQILHEAIILDEMMAKVKPKFRGS